MADRIEELKWMHLSEHIMVPALQRQYDTAIGRLLGEYRKGGAEFGGIIGEISALDRMIKTIKQGSAEYQREVSKNG